MQAGVQNLVDLGTVKGTPVSAWTSSYGLTYSATRFGVQFNGWPDGKATEDQPQVMLEVFDVMKDEALSVIKEEGERA